MIRTAVFYEAILVGLLNLLMFVIIRALVPVETHLFTMLILTGISVHILFEFSPFGNINESWCRATFPPRET